MGFDGGLGVYGVAMRDDAHRMVDEWPDSDLPGLLRLLRGWKGKRSEVPVTQDDLDAMMDDVASIDAGQVTMVSAEEMRRHVLG